tara:strand:+ start:252 stop:1118 length:867 start_codon:yes stop_codon:yes gene_type:complete
MRKYLLLAAILIIANFNYCQQEYKGLFWKVYGNNLSDTSYLYGTMHTQDERVFQFKDGVLDAFNSSKIYAMELNVDSINHAALLQELIMDSSASLKTLLSDSNYNLVDQYFRDSLAISLFLFEKISPIYTAQLIAMKDLGKQQKDALDLFFHNEAKKQGKKIIGLEKMSEQINAINSIPYKNQAEELVNAVNKAKNSKQNELETLIAFYVQGDLDTLLALTTQNNTNNEINTIIETVFILKRNQNMAERCEKYLKENSTFIAIGAAHLPGENGVIELLRKKGYKVMAN